MDALVVVEVVLLLFPLPLRLPPLPDLPGPSSVARLDMPLPRICINCCCEMLPNRLWMSDSRRLEMSELRTGLGVEPVDLCELGVGGLLSSSLTLRALSSSLSLLGSCSQKKRRRLDDLNLRTNTRPVVHWLTRLYSQSSGKMIRSSSTVPVPRSFQQKCIRASSAWYKYTCPFLLSGCTMLPFMYILPALNSTRFLLLDRALPPNKADDIFPQSLFSILYLKLGGEFF